MQNLVRFLEFVESFIKISDKSSKVQNKKTEIVKSISLSLSCRSIRNWSYIHLKTSSITAVTAVSLSMSSSLSSMMQSYIHIHFDYSDFTVFIFKVIEVSMTQIKRIRRAYIIIDMITAFIDERSFKLNNYHAKQLIKYLYQHLTVYQDEMISFLFDKFSIIINQSTVFKLLVTWKWSKKLIKCMII